MFTELKVIKSYKKCLLENSKIHFKNYNLGREVTFFILIIIKLSSTTAFILQKFFINKKSLK